MKMKVLAKTYIVKRNGNLSEEKYLIFCDREVEKNFFNDCEFFELTNKEKIEIEFTNDDVANNSNTFSELIENKVRKITEINGIICD